MPTPFSADNKIDFGAFQLLIDRQISLWHIGAVHPGFGR
jgi:dihydrodipicolinate synthase/N-acetylneuraminate lyase